MTETNSKEMATKRFAHLKAQIDKAFFGGSRFLPRQTVNLRETLLNHTKVVTDQEFIEESRRYHRSLNQPEEVIKIADEHAINGQANYYPPYSEDPHGKILIKESTLSSETNSDDYLLIIFLEELAHAYYRPTEESFNKVPEGSYRLLPFKTKAEYVKAMVDYKKKHHFDIFSVDAEKLTVRNSGFSSTVWDPGLRPDGVPMPYPSYISQNIIEEYRALILKTIFMAKVKGSIAKPYGSIGDQLIAGLEYITKMDTGDAKNFETITATAFITHFGEFMMNKDGIEKIILLLYGDPDTFFDYVEKRAEESFIFNNSRQHIHHYMNNRYSDKE